MSVIPRALDTGATCPAVRREPRPNTRSTSRSRGPAVRRPTAPKCSATATRRSPSNRPWRLVRHHPSNVLRCDQPIGHHPQARYPPQRTSTTVSAVALSPDRYGIHADPRTSRIVDRDDPRSRHHGRYPPRERCQGRARRRLARSLAGLVLAGVRASAETDQRAAPPPDQRRHERATTTDLLVRVPRSMSVRARPDSDAAVVGTMPSGSKYYGVPITAWVEETANHGRWGRVEIPYLWPRREGWIPLRDLARTTTHVQVHVDLSDHRVTVTKFGHRLFGLPASTGAPISPTPPGEYFVTDRIPFPSGGSLGTFAFGISGIQPNLPPGWSGGNQLAIHGTSDPRRSAHRRARGACG